MASAISIVNPAGLPALDTVASFATPEQTFFTHRLAGPMARVLAWGVDLAWRSALLLVVLLLLLMTGREYGLGLWLLLWFAADWLLGGLLEWRWAGRTPGKRLCGIRVVGQDGLPPRAAAAFLRNILRFADVLPTAATALAAMAVAGRFQRLGDLAAGTLVVYDDGAGVAAVRAEGLPPRARDLAERLPPEAAACADGPVLRAVAAYVARRRRFPPARRAELAAPLAEALAARLALPPPVDADLLLCALHLRLSEGGEDGADGLARSAGARAAAHLERRRRPWAALQAWAQGGRAEAAPREAGAGQPAAVRVAELYRGACADLALADAYHLPERTVQGLHRLVAAAHARFHRRDGGGWRALARQALWTVPARLHGDRCLRAALAAFFGTFLLAGLWGALRPDEAAAFLGQDVVDDLREMYADAPRGRRLDQGSLMAGFYVHNNVGIALACFASGIFAGIGALVWLAANGVFLGLCFGYMATVDGATSRHFFEFVSAHGPCELGGIALAGAAGLRLGLGLVDARGISRLASLRRAAGEAAPLLAVAGALVALAAPIEAFVSPSDLPLWAKRAVMAATGGALLWYVAVQGARARRAGPPW